MSVVMTMVMVMVIMVVVTPSRDYHAAVILSPVSAGRVVVGQRRRGG
jgi:hypothetical protein